MGQYGMTEEYMRKMQEGLEYQDFVSDKLRKSDPCFIIGAYASTRYQYERGESMSGLEVKFDKRSKETGRLYIEVAEKSNEILDDFTPSGIMRDDNTWLYLIGNYERAFLFSKKQLQILYAEKDKYAARGIMEVSTKTSKGFTVPINYAVRGACLREFIFTEGV